MNKKKAFWGAYITLNIVDVLIVLLLFYLLQVGFSDIWVANEIQYDNLFSLILFIIASVSIMILIEKLKKYIRRESF